MTLQLPNEIEWKLKDCAIVIRGDDQFKVQIINDEDGEYNQEMLIGFRSTDGEAIMKPCYYVKQLNTGICYWVHAEYLLLPQRSRPCYGLRRTKLIKIKLSEADARKVKASKKKKHDHKDHVLPISAKNKQNANSDLNTTYDQNHIAKLQNDNNELKKFECRGKNMMYDMLIENLNSNNVGKNINMQKLNCDDITTEDKIEILMGECLSKSEMDKYIYQCWRYNHFAKKPHIVETSIPDCPLANNSNIHITWCLVCGKRDNLQKCSICAASFHENCRQHWKNTIMHRKMAPHVVNDKLINVNKLSSTRTIKCYRKDIVYSNSCPSCEWGPAIGYGDVVWYKMIKCPWWPAKVLVPGLLPSCLLPMKHDVLPVRFYGTHNHAWCEPSRMCLFLTNHTVFLEEEIEQELHDAIMEAFDDYICVYLT